MVEQGPGRPEQRAAFLVGAVEHVLEHGLRGLSLRPLARRLGTSDRMLLYYFGTRAALVDAVLAEVTEGVLAALTGVLPGGRVEPPELLRASWDLARQPAVTPGVRLYVELLAAAAAGDDELGPAARDVADGWLRWAADRIDVPDADREAEAARLLVTLDGLLLLWLALGDDVAARAARGLGLAAP